MAKKPIKTNSKKTIKQSTVKKKPVSKLSVRKKARPVKVRKAGIVATIFGLLLLVLLAFFVTPNIIGMYTKTNKFVLGASTSGTVGNTDFKDTNFYACIIDSLNFYKINNKSNRTINYYAGDNELKQITTLNCDYRGILNIININKLTGLENINIEGNEISSVDFSNNKALERLWADGNNLTTINLTKNTKLIEIKLRANRLGSLDLSKNTSLESLDASYNGKVSSITQKFSKTLSSITMPKMLNNKNNYSLKSITLDDNNLTKIDLSKFLAAEYISVMNNRLTSIMLPSSIYLVEIRLSTNPLTSLDVLKNKNLEKLYIDSNKLSKLDLSENTQLTYVSNAGNPNLKIKSFTSPYKLNSSYTTLSVTSKNIATIISNIRTSIDWADIYVKRGTTKLTSGTIKDHDQLFVVDLAGTHRFSMIYTAPRGLTQ